MAALLNPGFRRGNLSLEWLSVTLSAASAPCGQKDHPRGCFSFHSPPGLGHTTWRERGFCTRLLMTLCHLFMLVAGGLNPGRGDRVNVANTFYSRVGEQTGWVAWHLGQGLENGVMSRPDPTFTGQPRSQNECALACRRFLFLERTEGKAKCCSFRFSASLFLKTCSGCDHHKPGGGVGDTGSLHRQ